MATTDEVFSELTEEALSDIVVIDNDLRTMAIPSTIKAVGVESDDSVFRLKFKMPSQYGEFDLSDFDVRINYTNASNEGDVYPVQDKAIGSDGITFSWLLGRFAFEKKGSIRFNVCLRKHDTDGVTVVKEFNTTPASLTVLEGLETDEAIVESRVDLITMYIQMIEEATASANETAVTVSELVAKVNEASEKAENAAASIEAADNATANANAATEAATTAATDATNAAKSANNAATAATTATTEATEAASSATTAANNANTATANANNAATSAAQAASSADTATTAANNAATAATEAATAATTAATDVTAATNDANNAATAANEAAEIALAAAKRADALRRMNGVYFNIKDHFDAYKDGKIYSVKIPNYDTTSSTACTKTDDNTGLVCIPSNTTSTSRDDYQAIHAFYNKDCNFYVDDNGEIFVTAVEGDQWFKRDGSNGDVGVLTPTLYWRCTEANDYVTISISDTKHDGFEVQPGGKLTDGTERPFVVYAKYAGCMYNGVYSSVSGQPLKNRTVSQNTLIDLATAKGAGYSGKTAADDWYVSTMFYLMFADKSSQSWIKGCTEYNYQYNPAVAETGVRRVILTNAQAASLVVGSYMMLGTHTSTSNDRNTAYNYDVFDGLKISAIETYDSSNKSVYFDTEETFDTETTYLLSTAPWVTGACDLVNGRNGYAYLNGKGPMLIQGIECAVGVYEILANVIINARKDSVPNYYLDVYICHDSANYQKSSVSGYTRIGELPAATVTGWNYSKDVVNKHGLYIPQGYGATSTTGNGDGVYQNVRDSQGFREWLSGGSLFGGADAGVRCVYAAYALGSTTWDFASRLSALGRSSA